jgi:hypothetical protein
MSIFFAWRVLSWSDFDWVDVEIWNVYAMSSWPVIGSLAASSPFWSHCGVGTTTRLLGSIARIALMSDCEYD